MKRTIDKAFLFISIAIGIVLGIILEVLYREGVVEFGNRIVLVVLYLGIFVLAMGVVLLIKGLQNGTFVNFGRVMLFTLLSIAVFVGGSVLFEYIYEMEFDTGVAEVKDAQYVFLIDDSGSMNDNDPGNQRYDAIENIIRGMKPTNDFAVYTFENSTHLVTAMGTENSQNYTFVWPGRSHDNPGTYMLTAILDAIEDVKGSTKNTEIIILTDGMPQLDDRINLEPALQACKDNNASISAVGFGDADDSYMRDMANRTGGIFVWSNDYSELERGLGEIVKFVTAGTGANRDLVGYRADHRYDSFLYAFLRVLFLLLLGVLWTIIKMLLVGEKKYTLSSALISGFMCIGASILCEVLMHFGYGYAMAGVQFDTIARVMLCGVWACTIIPKNFVEKVSLDRELHSGRSGSSLTGDLTGDFNSKTRGGGESKSFL